MVLLQIQICLAYKIFDSGFDYLTRFVEEIDTLGMTEPQATVHRSARNRFGAGAALTWGAAAAMAQAVAPKWDNRGLNPKRPPFDVCPV